MAIAFSYVAKTPDITLRGSLFIASQSFQPVGSPSLVRVCGEPAVTVAAGAARSHLSRPPACVTLDLWVVLGRPNMHKKTPWKTVNGTDLRFSARCARRARPRRQKSKCLPESVFSGGTHKTTLFASAGRTNLVPGSPF